MPGNCVFWIVPRDRSSLALIEISQSGLIVYAAAPG
jgi:hypothetical protein